MHPQACQWMVWFCTIRKRCAARHPSSRAPKPRTHGGDGQAIRQRGAALHIHGHGGTCC